MVHGPVAVVDVKAPHVLLRRVTRALAIGLVLAWASMASAQEPAPSPQVLTADWQRALDLMRENRPRAAVLLLERIADAVPGDVAVRSELGVALARSQQHRRARAELTRALEAAPSEAERRVIAGFLRQAVPRNPLSGSFSLGVMPETNVTRRSTLDSVTIGDLEFALDQTAQSGTGASVNAQLTYAPMIARDLRMRSSVRLDGRIYDDRALNEHALRLSSGVELLGDRGSVLGFGVAAEQRWARDARVLRERGVFATFDLQPLPDTQVFARAELAQRVVPILPRRDGTVQRLNFGVAQALRPQTRLTTRVFASRTRAQADFESGRLLGLGLGLRHAFDGGWQAQANLILSHERRDGPERAFDLVRKDRLQRLTVAVTNRNIQIQGFSPAVEIGTERRLSTVALNRFRNSFAAVSVTRGF